MGNRPLSSDLYGQSNPSIPSHQQILKACLIGLSLPILLYIVYSSPLGNWLSAEELNQLKSQSPYWYLWLPLFFWVLGTFAIGLGIPRTALSFLAGSLFGFWIGLGIIELTTITGACITFLYSRFARNSFLHKPIFSRLTALDGYLNKHGFATILLLRQTPVPGVLVNILLGLSPVKIRTFILASALGFLPQNVIFLLYGCGLKSHFITNMSIASAILIVLSVCSYYVYHHFDFAKNLALQVQLSKKDIRDQ